MAGIGTFTDCISKYWQLGLILTREDTEYIPQCISFDGTFCTGDLMVVNDDQCAK